MRTFAKKPKAAKQTPSTKSPKLGRSFVGQGRDIHSILHLQRTIGNQAVLKLLQTPTENIDAKSASSTSTGSSHDFSRIPVYPGTRNTIQPKLKVNAPRDRYEQEADRVADKVLRQETPDEEDEKLDIQTKPSLSAAGERGVSEHLENRLNRSRGSGSPLSHESQSFFEARMRHDFSNVRVHADSEATQMSRELGARAFTYDHDIYFGAGQYNPQSTLGKRLMAHELTHVVQQNRNTLQRYDDDELDAGVPLPGGIPPTEEEIRREYLQNTNPSELEDHDLVPAFDAAQDNNRYSSVLSELISRLDSDQNIAFGTALPRTIARGSGGNALVTPQIAMSMIENMVEGQHPFRPELGRGGTSSWFVTEGNPATGVTSQHTIPAQVELINTDNALQYNQADLNRIFAEEEARARPEVESQVRERFRIRTGRDAPAELSNSLRNRIARQLRQLAERRMWERIGDEVAASSNKVGRVTLPAGGRFSNTPGVFTVIADAAKIRLRGGIMPLIDALIRSGAVEIPPGLNAEATKMARAMNAAGRVRAVFRIGGRILIVIGIGTSIVDIIIAEDRLEAVVVNAAGWTGAIVAGSAFAAWFTPADTAGPWAWLAHGAGTLVAGGVGFFIGSESTRYVYRLVVRSQRRFETQ